MSLRERFLDAVIDGELGRGLLVTRQEFLGHFVEDNPLTAGCFLSNSEVRTGAQHSPSYQHFTLRVREGEYLIHPEALLARMRVRGIL